VDISITCRTVRVTELLVYWFIQIVCVRSCMFGHVCVVLVGLFCGWIEYSVSNCQVLSRDGDPWVAMLF